MSEERSLGMSGSALWTAPHSSCTCHCAAVNTNSKPARLHSWVKGNNYFRERAVFFFFFYCMKHSHFWQLETSVTCLLKSSPRNPCTWNPKCPRTNIPRLGIKMNKTNTVHCRPCKLFSPDRSQTIRDSISDNLSEKSNLRNIHQHFSIFVPL